MRFQFLCKTNEGSKSELLNIVHKNRKRCFDASLKRHFIESFVVNELF